VKAGIDPLAAKAQAKAERAAAVERKAKAVTFDEAADAYIQAHKAAWRRRSEQLWHNSLAQHVSPHFGRKVVGDVTTEDVLRALTPIWTSKTVTATIVRARIELVLDYAKGRGWRSGENSAVWRGNLRSLLPAPAKVHRAEHRPALAWREAPALMARIPDDGSMADRCLKFLVFTACRSGEARGARWSEIDLENAVWAIPASRMKAGKEHRVPLSGPAMAILAELARLRTDDDRVFFSQRQGRRLSDKTLKLPLRRLGYDACSVHGMRSTFRDWAADTGKPADLAEAALAHVVGSAVARAYQRSDLLDARRVLMQQWADYLTRELAQVVTLRRIRR
jgi:integrase